MEEKEENGITLGFIFRTILSQKWLALILAVVITVVGVVAFYFMGKNNTEYVMEFVLALPDSDESPATYSYHDGEIFNYTDYVDLEYLQKVKASDESFANIDVEKMVKSADITISRDLTETAEGTKEYVPSYKLSIKAKYFKEQELARDFMVALASSPLAHFAEMEYDYDYTITSSKNALTYDTQLTELEKQVNSLQSLYNSFINAYGSNFTIVLSEISEGASGVISLAQLKANTIDEYINKGLFATLKREALENGYVKSSTDTRERDTYQREWYETKEKLDIAENTLTELLNLQNSSGSILYADTIRTQILEVQQLTLDLKHIEDRLNMFDNNGGINAEFDAKVQAVEQEVKDLTEGVKPVAKYVYKTVAKINIPNANKVTSEGGMGLLKSGLISLVAGIVVALIVAYIVGYVKMRKTVHAEPLAEIPVYVQTQVRAQAAITDGSQSDDDKDDKKE